MKRFLRLNAFDLLAILALALGAMWFFVPSATFVREVSLSMTRDGRVTFVRELPFGPVRARFASEITTLGGRECHTPEIGTAYYQVAPGNTVSYEIGEWALPCIADGTPFYLRTVRTVLMFNFLPLRPMESITEVVGFEPDPAVLALPAEPEGAIP